MLIVLNCNLSWLFLLIKLMRRLSRLNFIALLGETCRCSLYLLNFFAHISLESGEYRLLLTFKLRIISYRLLLRECGKVRSRRLLLIRVGLRFSRSLFLLLLHRLLFNDSIFDDFSKFALLIVDLMAFVMLNHFLRGWLLGRIDWLLNYTSGNLVILRLL